MKRTAQSAGLIEGRSNVSTGELVLELFGAFNEYDVADERVAQQRVLSKDAATAALKQALHLETVMKRLRFELKHAEEALLRDFNTINQSQNWRSEAVDKSVHCDRSCLTSGSTDWSVRSGKHRGFLFFMRKHPTSVACKVGDKEAESLVPHQYNWYGHGDSRLGPEYAGPDGFTKRHAERMILLKSVMGPINDELLSQRTGEALHDGEQFQQAHGGPRVRRSDQGSC